MNKAAKNFCTVEITYEVDEVDEDLYDHVIVCTPFWPNIKVDRPRNYSIRLRDTPSKRRLAQRFKKAVEAGAVYTNPRVVKTLPDAGPEAQQTYVQWDGFKMAKYLNSDLKKLGF